MAIDGPTTAIDLGGTKIAAARVQGARILERRQVPTPRTGNFDDVLAAIAGLAGDWADGVVALATTGLVDQGRLTAINPKTLDVPFGLPIEALLGARLGVPVRAMNDAQAAAWGEYRHGAGQGTGSMLFLTVSTGIGGGLVLDGRLRTGSGGLAGHVGHILADPAGPLCGCGRYGCLEAVASGPALERAGARRLGRALTCEDLFRAATTDAQAAAVLDDAAQSIASVLCSLHAALELDCAVIGGSVGLATGFLARIDTAMAQAPARLRLGIRAARLGADAGLVGVADLASS
ncbi:N-acetylmannosamine kinase [Acidisoma cellulosilytica]|uniref:N-acetylmannosamine kinase n=1 Tax=Acidisoma cellulosilyticum TaxID=2802395 RepID=A0A963Z3F5_9PROT|nr:N-acetylmannosamine kinase [Acidisoma cellulosilyticum]MCB8881108.1 N-acetylmannosamine kinase [Acidisoma cellulosilyticum]